MGQADRRAHLGHGGRPGSPPGRRAGPGGAGAGTRARSSTVRRPVGLVEGPPGGADGPVDVAHGPVGCDPQHLLGGRVDVLVGRAALGVDQLTVDVQPLFVQEVAHGRPSVRQPENPVSRLGGHVQHLVEQVEEGGDVEGLGQVVGRRRAGGSGGSGGSWRRPRPPRRGWRRWPGPPCRRWSTTSPPRSGRCTSSRIRSGRCWPASSRPMRALQGGHELDAGAPGQDPLDQPQVGQVVLDVEDGRRRGRTVGRRGDGFLVGSVGGLLGRAHRAARWRTSSPRRACCRPRSCRAMASTSRWDRARPRPVPWMPAASASRRSNGVKSRSSRSGRMPGPVSATRTVAVSSA